MEFLIALLVGGTSVGLVLAIIYFSFRWVWRLGRVGQCALGLVAIGIAYLVYDANYPSEAFYMAQLEGLTGVKLPSNAVFVEKTASFPDTHGDYSACFVVRLTTKEMAEFKAKLNKDVQITKSEAAEARSCDFASPANSPATDVLRIDLSQRVTRPDATVIAQITEQDSLVKIEWHLW